jgi:hypothetical protein
MSHTVQPGVRPNLTGSTAEKVERLRVLTGSRNEAEAIGKLLDKLFSEHGRGLRDELRPAHTG